MSRQEVKLPAHRAGHPADLPVTTIHEGRYQTNNAKTDYQIRSSIMVEICQQTTPANKEGSSETSLFRFFKTNRCQELLSSPSLRSKGTLDFNDYRQKSRIRAERGLLPAGLGVTLRSMRNFNELESFESLYKVFSLFQRGSTKWVYTWKLTIFHRRRED